MGRDKALLPFRGTTLVQHLAALVEAVTGSVALVGDPQRYRHLGYPVIPDIIPDTGPLGGIHAALNASAAEWNLIVACDMPAITPGFVSDLMDLAEGCGADCLIPAGPTGRPEPLCGVYHIRTLSAIEVALQTNIRRIIPALASLNVRLLPMAESVYFENCNTPQDWASHTR